MSTKQPQYTFDRVVRMVLTAVTLTAMFVLARYLSDVLLPFAAAVVLAYLLNPLVTVFERKTNRRGLAVAFTLGGLSVISMALVVLVVPLMVSQVTRFQANLSRLRADFEWTAPVAVGDETPGEPSAEPGEIDAIESMAIGWPELKDAWSRYRSDSNTKPQRDRLWQFRADLANTYLGHLWDDAVDYSRSDEFKTFLVEMAKRLAIGGWTVVAFAINVLLGLAGLVIVLLYLVFLLVDYPEYARTWQTFLPPNYREPIVEFLGLFDEVLRRYFRAQSVVAMMMGVLFAVGFSIIGLPMAVPLGLFVGLLNMVPYLQMVGLVPAMLLAALRALEHGSSFAASVLLTLAVFAAAQLIQDALITPRVMGKATGLKPVAILLGVFIWGKLLGFLGLLLAIPLTCLGIAYYRRFVLLSGAEASNDKPG